VLAGGGALRHGHFCCHNAREVDSQAISVTSRSYRACAKNRSRRSSKRAGNYCQLCPLPTKSGLMADMSPPVTGCKSTSQLLERELQSPQQRGRRNQQPLHEPGLLDLARPSLVDSARRSPSTRVDTSRSAGPRRGPDEDLVQRRRGQLEEQRVLSLSVVDVLTGSSVTSGQERGCWTGPAGAGRRRSAVRLGQGAA
jgi:hypothetical protein